MNVGVTSNGQVFVQFQREYALGIGMYEGVGVQAAVNVSRSHLEPGLSVQHSYQVDTNAGWGASMGGSVNYDGDGGGSVQSGVAKYGLGFGMGVSGGEVTAATISSPELW